MVVMTINSAQKNLIEFLRLIATILVFLGHLFTCFAITPLSQNTYFGYLQYLGVIIFVIISGFLLEKSLQSRMEEMTFWQYFAHRNNKTYFAYVLAIFFTVVGDSLIRHTGSYDEMNHVGAYSAQSLLASLTYFSDIEPLYSFGTSHQLWYMSAWFWLSAMVICFSYIKRKGINRIIDFIAMISCALICINLRHVQMFPAIAVGFVGGY